VKEENQEDMKKSEFLKGIQGITLYIMQEISFLTAQLI